MAVGGLPFVQSGTTTDSRASLNIGSVGNWNDNPFGCVIIANADYANLNANMNEGSTLTDSAMTGSSFVFITGTYLTDS